MKKIAVLHLVNMLTDSSISRIAERIMRLSNENEFSWFIWPEKEGGNFTNAFIQAGAQIVNIPNQRGNLVNRSRTIGKFAAENGIDIIHTHTPRTILTGWLASRGNKRIKHLTTKHLLTTSADRNVGPIFALFDRISLLLPDQVVAVSQWMGDEILRFPGIQKDHVSIIRNAIPVEEFYCPSLRQDCRAEFHASNDTILIGYIGRVDLVKRIDLLLAAFHEIKQNYPNCMLLIAGEGKLQNEMQEMARQFGVAKDVCWTGFRTDIPRLLAGIDIFVQPSINEGLSLSLMEAMAAKKAIIATDVGGTHEIIQNGINGFLIQPGSVEAMSNAISNLIRDQKQFQTISEQAYSTALKCFNLRLNVDKYDQEYNKLAQRNNELSDCRKL